MEDDVGRSGGLDPTLPVSGRADTAEAATPMGPTDDFGELRPIDPENYILGTELAHGGMGRILTARDRRLGRPVAIKELLIKSEGMRARFEREARITAHLQHPGILDPDRGTRTALLTTEPPRSLSFSPDGASLVVTAGKAATILDARTGVVEGKRSGYRTGRQRGSGSSLPGWT